MGTKRDQEVHPTHPQNLFPEKITEIENQTPPLPQSKITVKEIFTKLDLPKDNDVVIKVGDIKKHIESNHVEGICVPCNLCEKTFRSRDSLRMHKRRNH